MKFITLIIGLLVVGCERKINWQPKGIEKRIKADPQYIAAVKAVAAEKAVGTYEAKKDGDTYKWVFLENGVTEGYENGKKYEEGKWSISKEGEMHIIDDVGDILVLSINKDGSITWIADIDKDGKREAIPKEDQETFKKIK